MPAGESEERRLSTRDEIYYDLAGVIADIEDEVCKDTLRRVQARLDALLAQLEGAAVAEGWVMVPREDFKRALRFLTGEVTSDVPFEFVQRLRAMLAASPTPEGERK